MDYVTIEAQQSACQWLHIDGYHFDFMSQSLRIVVKSFFFVVKPAPRKRTNKRKSNQLNFMELVFSVEKCSLPVSFSLIRFAI